MIDFLLDENFDITNNLGEATDQTTEIVVMSQKGSFKKYPTIGVNALDFIKSGVFTRGLEGRIKLELEVDGAKVDKINFSTPPFEVKARWVVGEDLENEQLFVSSDLPDNIIQVTVLPGQTIIDVAIQYLGDAAGAIDLAQLNNISITENLQAGQALKINTGQVLNQGVVTYLAQKNITPITN